MYVCNTNKENGVAEIKKENSQTKQYIFVAGRAPCYREMNMKSAPKDKEIYSDNLIGNNSDTVS
jgi:hypothetical protein